MPRSQDPWTKETTIALLGVLVSLAGVAISMLNEDVRCFLFHTFPGSQCDQQSASNQPLALEPSGVSGASNGLQAQDCGWVIAEGQKRIEENRGIQEVAHRAVDFSELYPDHPPNRPDSYLFVIEGEGVSDFMTQGELMKSIASAIIQSCSSIGVVEFGKRATGWSFLVGLTASGTVDFFQCVEYDRSIGRDKRSKLLWGQQRCDR